MFRFGRLFAVAWIALSFAAARIEADDESILWNSSPFDSRTECCDETCHECSPSRPCCCLTDDRYWLRGEALLWWTDGMHVPPLISASPPGTALADAGVLGTPGATILFGGNERLLNSPRVGWRLQGGGWLDCDKQVGVEGDYLNLPGISERFSVASDGSDIISRPFRNALTQSNDAELVSYPGVLAGRVTVTASTEFQSAGARLRWNLDCEDLGCGDVLRWHLLTGYRYAQLNESLVIREELTSLDPLNPGSFDLHDRFRTSNQFHGAEVGSVFRLRSGRWDCELLTKLALGNVRQSVTINSDTQTDVGGVIDLLPGGLLGQRSNIGSYQRNRFAVLPEIGLTMGYRVTNRLSASLGYSLIWWYQVARPGDQIDPTVNPNLIPPEAVPFTGPLRPEFRFRDDSFWAQGINLGLTYRW